VTAAKVPVKILIVAEHDGERLNPSTSRCVRLALDLEPHTVDVAVFAATDNAPFKAAASLYGVSRVLALRHAAYHGLPAAAVAPELAALAARYTHLLGPSTTFGKDLLPRVAALRGVGQISDVMQAETPYRFRRPVYAGNAIQTIEADPERLLVATVRTASFVPVENGEPAPIEDLPVTSEPPTTTRYDGLQVQRGERPDLQSAARVVAGGRALGSKEGFALIYQLADSLGAAVGASRAAVDSGFVANELQVGQTGKIIAPNLYIAIGISGAIQHITGIKDARTIVAINRDADAPIFEIADLGLVADLFQAVPELITALQQRGSSNG
jgi:electron transfer flavoprotein alpha subunit